MRLRPRPVERGAAVRHQGDRSDPHSRGAVLHAAARRPRRRGDQGRAARARRSGARPGRDQGRPQLVLRPVQSQQEIADARSVRRCRQGGARGSDPRRRRAGRELPAGRARQDGLRSGASEGDQPGAGRRQRERLRQHRAVRRPAGVRLHRPGDERLHERDRRGRSGARARGPADRRPDRRPVRGVRHRRCVGRPRRARGRAGPAGGSEPHGRPDQHARLFLGAAFHDRAAAGAHRQRPPGDLSLRTVPRRGRRRRDRAEHASARQAPARGAGTRSAARRPGVRRQCRARAQPRAPARPPSRRGSSASMPRACRAAG
jgi:hypothetical protein